MSEKSQRAFGSQHPSGGERGAGQRPGRAGVLATVLAAVFALALIAVPSAGAAGFQANGTFSDPAMSISVDIAVDPASGNVYVAHRQGAGFSGPGSILRFDAAGAPLSPPDMGSGYYVGVAVEQGGDHTVYGYDNQLEGAEGTPYIEAFDSAGSPLGTPFDVDPSSGQLASDSAGNVYFADTATDTVKKYTSSGAVGTPTEFSCSGTDCNSIALSEPRGVAVDGAGNLYVADSENGRVIKFNSDGSYDSVFYEGAALGLAVDTSAELVLVAGNDGAGQHVTALDYSGNPVGEIPDSAFPGALSVSLAVNPDTETLYALAFSFLEPKVYVFNILASPTAVTGSATGVTASGATLNGTANPKGSTSEDCRFEYTDDADFQANEWVNAESAPCSPQPFNEETDVAVSAAITGLAGGTTYDYRVVEETESGLAEGAAEQFTTLSAPSATTGGASAISQHAATLAASVNPNGEATTNCHIEWGPSAGNYSSGQAACSPNPGSASTSTAVSVAASGLAAGTTYHYRVVEITAAGTANGADMSFATLADTCDTNAALCPPKPPVVTPPVVTPPVVTPPANNQAACVKKANEAFKKAQKAAKKKKGKARAKAMKQANKRKHKAIAKCKGS